jgi:hypothetical protein
MNARNTIDRTDPERTLLLARRAVDRADSAGRLRR